MTKYAVEQIVLYFCFGFTFIVLPSLLFGHEVHLGLAIGAGMAAALGRVLRFLAAPPGTPMKRSY